jgi:ribosomal protein S6--L-glutamate ligase
MNIVTLSTNRNLYSTRRLVEAAEDRGHECKVMNHTKCYVVMEKGETHIFYKDHEVINVDAIIPRIGSSVTFYGSSIIRQFEMQKVFTTTSSLALVRSRDKLRSLQILARNDIGIPRTAFAKKNSDIDSLIRQVGGPPLIIKLLQSTQGKGVVLADTRKAAESVLEAFYSLDASILVQEFIKEAKAADIRAFVINGEVVAAMKRQGKEDEFRSNLHKGGTGTAIKLSRREKAVAIKAAKALNLNIAGVDMLQSERGPLVIEVNSSPGLEGIENATGVDVAGKIIEFIESHYRASSQKVKDKIGA